MSFPPSSDCVWIHHMDTNEKYGEKARWELHKNATFCFEQIQLGTPHKTAAVTPFTSHLANQLETSKT